MLRLKSFLFAAVVLLFSTAAIASDSSKEPKSFKASFTEAMESIDFEFYDVPHDRVYIEFMVNEDREIVVLATSAKSIDKVIKDKINYLKVSENELTPFQKYTIKVLIERK